MKIATREEVVQFINSLPAEIVLAKVDAEYELQKISVTTINDSIDNSDRCLEKVTIVFMRRHV